MLAALCVENDALAYDDPLLLEGLEYREYPDERLEALQHPYFAVFILEHADLLVHYAYRSPQINFNNPSIRTGSCVQRQWQDKLILLQPRVPIQQLREQQQVAVQLTGHANRLRELLVDYKCTAQSQSMYNGYWNCHQRFLRKLGGKEQLGYTAIVHWNSYSISVELRRKHQGSDRRVDTQNWNKPDPEAIRDWIAQKIQQDRIDYQQPQITFHRFCSEPYATREGTRKDLSLYTVRSNSQLRLASYCGAVTLRGNRLYRDVERPGAECWYLLDCYTHAGSCLAMIVDEDVERFHPMRFTSSNNLVGINRGAIALGYLIQPEQLGQDVSLEHIGPRDRELIVEAIKGGLAGVAHRPQ